MIKVEQTGHAEPLEFEVEVGAQRHRVSMSCADYRRLTRGAHPPELLIEAAFRFLLDREPPEAILARFDIDLISRYFPEFETELPHYLRSSNGDGG